MKNEHVYIVELEDPSETFEKGILGVYRTRQIARDFKTETLKQIKDRMSFYPNGTRLKVSKHRIRNVR